MCLFTSALVNKSHQVSPRCLKITYTYHQVKFPSRPCSLLERLVSRENREAVYLKVAFQLDSFTLKYTDQS
jgi:hypothetical protein